MVDRGGMTERFARRLAGAALALALVISGCAVASPSASSSSGAAESSAASPSVAPGFIWARASRLPVVREHSVVVAAAPVGEGFVAFSLDGEGGHTDLWHSPDGRTWESVSPRGDPVSEITGVLAAEGRLLAFGNGGNGEEVRAAFWTSEDGVTWRRAQADFDGGQVIDVAAGDDGFVAVGQGIWTSNSGETWTRVADIGQLEGSFLWAVARGGPGFVAVGWRPNPEPDLAVWTSVNGRDWELAPNTPGGQGFEGRDVVERDGMLVMVGDRVEGGTAGAWTSTDGVTWRPAEPSASFGTSAMVRVIAMQSGLLAVGSRNVDDAGVWTSSDGRAWETVDDLAFADAYLTDATVADGVVVLVGATQEKIAGTTGSYTSAAMAWYGEIHQR